MMELIDKQKTLADLKGIKDVIQSQGDPFLANIIERAIGCVERQPTADSVLAKPDQDDEKLAKAIRGLREYYARAHNLGHVYNKLGWALYRTWSKYE